MKNLIRNATEPLAGSGLGEHFGFLPSREFRCWKSTGTSTSDYLRPIPHSFRKLSLPFSEGKHTSFVARSRVPFHKVENFDKCDMSEGDPCG